MTCPHCGCEFEARKRSSKSNAYLWAGVYAPIAKHLGYTAEQVHDAFKDRFLAREDLTTGLRIAQSTATLSQERFGQYVDQVREWSHAFLGIYIDSPDEWRESA